MDTLPLKLTDLSPKDTPLKLSTREGKPDLFIGRWTLRVRAWAEEKFTAKGLTDIFKYQKAGPLSELAFYMLKDKSDYKTLEEFQDAVVTIQDQINLINAILGAVGIGEPEVKQIEKKLLEAAEKEGAADPNEASPKT